jgi:hypothetical protein
MLTEAFSEDSHEDLLGSPRGLHKNYKASPIVGQIEDKALQVEVVGRQVAGAIVKKPADHIGYTLPAHFSLGH